jgi:hypothetical protein
VAEIDVSATDEPRVYDVAVDEAGRVSRHRVTVPDNLAGAGLPEVEPERLVRESFVFLLEREPASAILREFELTVIGRYFPDYTDELRRRLG